MSTRQNRQESVLQSQLQTLEVTAGAPGEVQEKVRHREKLEKCATTPSFLFVRTKTQVLQSVPPSLRVSLSLANTETSSSNNNNNNKAAKNTLQKSTTTATTAASNEDKAKSLGMAPNKRERNRAEPQKKRHQEDSGTRKERPDFNNVYLIFMECLVGM